MVEAPGEEGGLYRSDDSGATVEAGEQRGEPPRASVLLPLRRRQSEEPGRRLGERARAVQVHERRQDVHDRLDAARRQSRHLVQSRQPALRASSATTAARTSRRDGGRTWSSILNQPTGRVLHGQRRRAASLPALRPAAGQLDAGRAERADRVVRLRSSGAGVDAGVGLRDRRHLADARRQGRSGARAREKSSASTSRPVSRRAAGSIRRTATATIPTDIKYRFPRQTVVMVSPHDPKVVYQASHVLHRTTDDGVTWQVISPDLTAHDPKIPDRAGQPDHARRHRRRGLLVDLRDGRVAARARRALGRRQRRSGARDARQRQDVEERHAEGPAAGRAGPEHRRRRRIAAGSAYIAVYRYPARARSEAVHLPDRRLRRDVDEADRRRQRHSRTITRRASSARIRSARACSTPAPSSASSCRSTTAAAGSRCSRTCRPRRSRTSASTAAISSSRRWGGRSGSWTTCRRCGSMASRPSDCTSSGTGDCRRCCRPVRRGVALIAAAARRYRAGGGARRSAVSAGGARDRLHPPGRLHRSARRSRLPTAPAASSAPCTGCGRRRARDRRGGSADAGRRSRHARRRRARTRRRGAADAESRATTAISGTTAGQRRSARGAGQVHRATLIGAAAVERSRADEELRGEGRSRRAERRHHRRRPRRAAELPAAGARHGGRGQPAARRTCSRRCRRRTSSRRRRRAPASG